MKNLKSVFLFAVLFIAENILSQADSSAVFILPQVEVTQLKNKHVVSYAFKQQDRNKFILSDSFLTGNPDMYNYHVKISDIRALTFRKGSHFWTGAAILGGAGFLFGFLVVGSLNDIACGANNNKPFRFDRGLLGGFICAVPTGLIGGLIGLIFPKYDTYNIAGMSKEQKARYIQNLFFEYEVEDF
jgi:hypothetical protein